MITYSELAKKFIDKGYLIELHYLVIPPTPYIYGKLIGTKEEQETVYKQCVQELYGEEYDYWEQWIDHQNYK